MSTESKRNPNLDALRGIAFIAVISLNLIGEFRLPFWQSLQNFHTSPGWLNHATDWLVGLFLDQKGFTILTFLFGLGTAMLAEKYGLTLLLRRFLFLLVLGLVHMFLVFSGDILTPYALCGLLLLPLLRRPSGALGAGAILFLTVRLSWSGLPVPYAFAGQHRAAHAGGDASGDPGLAPERAGATGAAPVSPGSGLHRCGSVSADPMAVIPGACSATAA